MKKFIRDKRKGVLLVEIMVVIVIFGLLILLEIPNTNVRQTGRGNSRESLIVVAVQFRLIENTLDIYRKHNGFYPTTEQGLEALVTKPTSDPQPENYYEGGYFKKLPMDPWGNPFIYRRHGDEGPIEIISCGWDGEEGTEDDITNHNIDAIFERR